MDLEDRLGDLRATRESQGLWRSRLCGQAGSPLQWDLRGNDPLDLGRHAAAATGGPETTPASPSPLGATASRLVSGNHPEHEALERCLADWVGLPQALVFSSAYLANLALLPALAREEDTVYSDASNHASIIDGCRLSRASRQIYAHLDLRDLATRLSRTRTAGVSWVVTESYFGMEGTGPDLSRLRELCDREGAALVVDEAHALGVFGPGGAGRCAEAGIQPEVLVGGLGKSVAAQGGFVAGSGALRDALWNAGRSFVYTTGLSPWLSSRACAQVELLRSLTEGRRRLHQASVWLDRELRAAGIRLPSGRTGPIFPLIAGQAGGALALAKALADRGLAAQAIRPPTVPLGAALVRLTLREALVGELGQLARAIVDAWQEVFGRAAAPNNGSGQTLGPDAEHPRSHFAGDPGPHSGGGRIHPGLLGPALRRRPPPSPSETQRSPSSACPSGFGLARRWLVLGTGTDVGKTFFCEVLCRALAARGLRVGALKPIETGLGSHGEAPDVKRLESAASGVRPPSPHPLYGYAEPLTPALAARRAERPIEWAALEQWLHQVEKNNPEATWIVEGAGGAFSPLADGATNVELARRLRPDRLLLVGPDRLGTLHDVLSTVRALRSEAHPPDLVVLSKPGTDSSVGTNLDELRRQPGMPPVVALAPDPLAALTPWLDAELALPYPPTAAPSS